MSEFLANILKLFNFAFTLTQKLVQMNIRLFLIIVTIVFSTTSCIIKKRSSQYLAENLEIKWELTENKLKPFLHSEACFTFYNRGNRTIKGTDWQLFFTQQSMQPLMSPDSTLGRIEHINGYFFRFAPTGELEIEPGDSLKFRTVFGDTYIKDAFCPAGVYLVAFQRTGNESIFTPHKYTRTPLGTGENVFPGFDSLIATPENIYKKYSNMKRLPAEDLGLIIPIPVKMIKSGGNLLLRDNTVVISMKGTEKEAKYLAETVTRLYDVTIPIEKSGVPASNTIVLKLKENASITSTEEGYSLSVTKEKGVLIEGYGAAGLFYGIQSLIQLTEFDGETAEIPCVEINDSPRFRFRGFMLDVARNFQDKQSVKKLIDLLALYKINSLDIRLTDDEGWRIEIPGIPELTNVGARRGHTLDASSCLMPAFGSGPWPDSTGNFGTGYFKREDFIDLIKYAGERHIQLIPEICFPSHANAAIKSMEARYRKFISSGDTTAAEQYRLIDPDDKSVYYSAQMFTGNVACAARESIYTFYEKILNELISMYSDAGYPLRFFHNGGDEVPEGAWTGSPMCVNLVERDSTIGGIAGLHPWFFKRILDITEKYGLTTGGWEEVVLKKNKEGQREVNRSYTQRDVVPFIWDNTGENSDLGYRIANAGYNVVLCCATNLYFDFAYSTDPSEPGHYWAGFEEEKDPFVLTPFNLAYTSVYNDYGYFDTSIAIKDNKEKLLPGNEKRILGLQAQLWTETVKGRDMMEYYTIPKIFAFAEKAWAPAPEWESEPNHEKRIEAIQKDWNEFACRIVTRELPRLDNFYGGYNYRIPPPGAIIENGLLKANISLPGLSIRYTTDGTEPTVRSHEYTGPVEAVGPVKIRAFNKAGRGSKTFIVY